MDPIKTTPGWEREELPFTGIFHLGDQGCEVMGAEMVLEVPPCPSPPREEKKMENPWEIPGKSLVFSAVLSFSAGPGGSPCPVGSRGFCGIRRKIPLLQPELL